MPELKKGFIDSTPEDKKGGIPVGELGAEGGNKDMILKLAQEIADGKHDLYDNMLISYKSKLSIAVGLNRNANLHLILKRFDRQ